MGDHVQCGCTHAVSCWWALTCTDMVFGFVFVSSDVVCIGSFQHRPEVRETLRFASSSVVRVYTLHTQIKKKHITELLFIWLNLFQANPFTFFLTWASLKNQFGAVTQNESASFLCPVKIDIWARLCQQMNDVILMNTQTYSSQGHRLICLHSNSLLLV